MWFICLAKLAKLAKQMIHLKCQAICILNNTKKKKKKKKKNTQKKRQKKKKNKLSSTHFQS